MIHQLPIRVYYEDTDLAGIVYYANYLKFIERGRSELVRALGISQTQIKDDTGVVFAVRRVEADYLLPATLEDDLMVETEVLSVGGARAVMRQLVKRGETVLFQADVTIVSLADTGRPARFPAEFRSKLTEFGEN
ncbi:MAG: tol-pal system-associated acyl-CoA thioesterase [Halocynthiibacter sp.]